MFQPGFPVSCRLLERRVRRLAWWQRWCVCLWHWRTWRRARALNIAAAELWLTPHYEAVRERADALWGKIYLG